MTEHLSVVGRLLQEGWHELSEPCPASELVQAERVFSTAHQTILSCKATGLGDVLPLGGSMDVASLRAVRGGDAGEYKWRKTCTYAAVLVNGSMAADIIEVLSQCVTSANSLDETSFALHVLQNLPLLLEVLAILWSQAEEGLVVSTAARPAALLGPYLAAMVPSSSCTVLAGVVGLVHYLDRLTYLEAPHIITAGVVAAACLIRLMTTSEAARNAAGGAMAAAQLLPRICYVVSADRPRVRWEGVREIVAAILADTLVVPAQGSLPGMRALLTCEPELSRMLLDMLTHMVESPNGGWLQGYAVSHTLLCADPERSVLQGLYATLSAEGAWPCPLPVSEEHMRALRSLASARVDAPAWLQCMCRLACEFLPRIASLSASASGRAFLDAESIASVALRGGAWGSSPSLDRALFELVEAFFGRDGHVVPPKVKVSRARWIVRQGFMQQCEALVRRHWREELTGEALVNGAPAPLCLKDANSLLRLAMIVTQSLGSELRPNHPAVAAVLSAVATVRKALCRFARAAAAMRYEEQHSHVTGGGGSAQGGSTPRELHDIAGGLPVVQLDLPEILDLMTAVVRDPPQLLDLPGAAVKTHAELQSSFLLQLVPPVAHVVRLLHASLGDADHRRLLQKLFEWVRCSGDREACVSCVGCLFAHFSIVAQLIDLIVEVVTTALKRRSYSTAQRDGFKASLAEEVGSLASSTPKSCLQLRLAPLLGSSDDSSASSGSSPTGLPAVAASGNTTSEEERNSAAAATDPLVGCRHKSWDSLALAGSTNTGRHWGCWCRGCRNFSGDSERDLRLLRCGGCRRAWYCSAACQRRAWRAGHRTACQTFHTDQDWFQALSCWATLHLNQSAP